jgi:hypothetical protein
MRMRISSEESNQENAAKREIITLTWINTLDAIENADPDLYVDTLKRINAVMADALAVLNVEGEC